MYSFVPMNQNRLGEQDFLIYELDSTDKIDHVEVEMMKNNEIPGILTFTDTRNNDDITLMYDVTKKMSLRKFWGGIVTMENVFAAVSGILKVLSSSERYMMSAEHFLLSAEQIYINVETRNPELIFLPMESELAEQMDWREFLLKELNEITYDPQGGVEKLAILKEYISEESKSLSEIIEKIDEIASGKIEESLKKESSATSISQNQSMTGTNATIGGNVPSGNMSSASVPSADNNFFVKDDGLEQRIQNKPIFHSGNTANGSNVQPAQADYIDTGKGKSSGGILGDIFSKKPKKEKEKKAVKPAPPTPIPSSFGGIEIPGQASNKVEIPSANATGSAEMSIPGGGSVPVSTPAPKKSGGFSLSGAGKKKEKSSQSKVQEIEATVLAEDLVFAPYLIEKSTGRKVLIDKTEFLVGRDPNAVSMVCSDKTVGRLHASVVLDTANNQAYIRDANSQNGTYINGNSVRIQSNINVPLEDGMVIRFGRGHEEYQYYSG